MWRDEPKPLSKAEAARWAAAREQEDPPRMLLPREVARMFGVDTKTVGRWLNTGRLEGRRTPGGHWRIPAENVEKFLNPLDTS